MAIKDIFKKKVIEEKVISQKTEKDIETARLFTSSKTLITGTDVSNTDDTRLLNLYRQMENDAVISAALDLYADNATQINMKIGHVAAIESSDKNFQDEINEFLWKIVKIDSEAWHIVRSIARDGKVFLDTKASENGLEWSFVPVDNPALIKPLIHRQDEIKYFVVSPEVNEEDRYTVSRSFQKMYSENQDPTNYQVEPSDRYIAGFNTREIVGKMSVASESRLSDEPVIEEFKIRSGRSILASVLQTWQTLSALEDALYINRLTKSTEFKIVQVDVGDSTNKQAEQIINAVKDSFKNSESIDQASNRYQNRQSPMPINDFIYAPKKGDKGTVTVTPVGGEVSEVAMGDIEYFRNKLFAGLGVLKAYLGFEETTPGGLGDSTLTKLDERLGRRILRLQQILKSIIYDIVSYYWKRSTLTRAYEEMPDFNIILGKVSTREEEENSARIKDNLDIADRVITIATSENFTEFVSKERLFKYIFEDIIGIDTAIFDNKLSEEEVPLKVKEIKDKLLTETFDHSKNVKFKKTKQEVPNLITGKLEKLLDKESILKLKNILEDYDIFLEDEKGNTHPLYEALDYQGFKKVFTEKTYAQLKDMSKRRDPARLKKSKSLTAKYKGLDDENNVVFQVTAEDPEKNKAAGRPTSYETKVSLKDLAYLINANKEDEAGLTDKELTQMAIQGDVAVSCTCPAAKYWGQQYNGTQDEYALDKNDIPPTVRIPTQPLCKHTILTLTVLPFWYNTIVRDLRAKGVLETPSKKKKVAPADKVKNKEQE
jgi:hypothetical protein